MVEDFERSLIDLTEGSIHSAALSSQFGHHADYAGMGGCAPLRCRLRAAQKNVVDYPEKEADISVLAAFTLG